MKTQNTKLTRKGVTLIELTVVIAVILTLIGILFVGAQTYQRHANKSACIVIQNGINKAVRSATNLNGANLIGAAGGPGAIGMWTFAGGGPGDIVAQGFLPNNPVCPESGAPFTVVNGNTASGAGTVFSPCPTFAGGFTGVLAAPMPGAPPVYSITAAQSVATVTVAGVTAPAHVPNLNNIGGW